MTVTALHPARRWALPAFGELWQARELLYFLVWRDVKVRYKQTVLGAAWAILQPLAAMLIFTVVFGRVVKVASDGVPYALFTYVGLLPWTYFAQAVTQQANSLIGSAHLVTKVYVPRVILPLAAGVGALIDLAIAFVILVPLMAWSGVAPAPAALLAPAFVLLGVGAAFAAGIWLAALNVRYRDVRYALPFFIQLGLFATPVVYPSSLLSEPWRTVSGLNPMTGVVEGLRWSLLGTPFPGRALLVSAVSVLILLVAGLTFFQRVEDEFADVV
jgi:lipopolysaccharide transport system permease protein